ncbi:SPOR domain-containing protein [Sphingomonas sp. 2R-10]|uniref:SPOR domain-containing protein n=1 Tax=Sphingomonas sp. 2R-10 TaxID=3045148 RepID=UPI000F77FED6|nr:SPOR domain-containing protein [Sphingomonas sp. 2R-10]MDJ0277797.1 SPOR domain-containing protein [Sphingomonas sp. 2R-10]
MKTHLLVSIGLATAMLGGSLALVAGGTVAVASSEDGAAGKFAGKALQALAKHRPAQAVTFAEQAVALSPRDATYRSLLGRAYLAAGRFASATQAFSDVLALDPTDAKAALNLALAQTATGEWVAARDTLTAHSARISPADRGLALALAGDPAGGIALLSEAARDPAATATIRQNLALALALDGRWVDARTVASVDMAPAQVDQRLVEWAAFARPEHAAQQVAALLGVTPAPDRGQPVQLALSAPAAPVALAQADPVPDVPAAVVPVEPVVDTPIVPAVPAPVRLAATVRPAITFAPRREIVQALPASYLRQAPVRMAARARATAAPAAQAATGGNYYVQLGAFDNAAVARDAWRRMRRNVPRLSALTPQGMQASIRGASFYRLSVGGLARADAATLCGSVRAKGDRCFVRTHAGEQLASWARPERLAAR